MARLRPARTCRKPNSQSWARYSQKKPRKNYIRALPHTSIQIFDMGKDKPEYDFISYLTTNESIQLRSNALEAARTVAHKFLDSKIPEAYYMKLLVYPHNVIREHKMASGAGADRVSRGMSLAFGKPISVAARLRPNQHVFLIKTNQANKEIAIDALKRASAKLSGTYYISNK
ncbi:MAG: 50S ribosomal protein L16 [Candidatus Micrarchaeia archaeon]